MIEHKPEVPRKPVSDRQRRPTLNAVWPAHSAFDIRKFREQPYDLSLRR